MPTQDQHSETEATALYRRELPGGGFVAIDVRRLPMRSTEVRDASDRGVPRTRVYVERRSEENRRSGHEPPIIAEVMGEASGSEIGELFRMAADNVALARALLAWQTRRLVEAAPRSE
jgi:hypothetical protein